MARFLSDARGATAIEYALIGSLIAMVLVTALGSMGGSISQMLTDVAAPFGA
ncbi:MAG TPA: Flp family type IVb pilin [Caulobacterales bacterium]|nr:Flp family type IVb pilin [Caulobacterales bacterium]